MSIPIHEGDADGFFRVSYLPASHRCDARWNEATGELTLERDDRVIVATRDSAAFRAAVRLLATEPGVMLVFHEFTLVYEGDDGLVDALTFTTRV